MGFYTWVDDANISGNIQDDATFASDSQRENGFQSGTVASSIRVNTALRQATLVTAALMTSMSLGSMSYEDSFSDINTAIDGFFANLAVVPNPTLDGTETTLTGLKIGGTKYKVPSSGGGTTVIANPSPEGTTKLTGIQIGTTKYTVKANVVTTILYSTSFNAITNASVTLTDYVSGYDKIEIHGYMYDNLTNYGNLFGTVCPLIYTVYGVVSGLDPDLNPVSLKVSVGSKSLTVISGYSMAYITKIVGYKYI